MRLLLSTIAKVFYNERLREAVKLNREADLRYQMAGIRLADAESRYLELTKLASEEDFDGDFPKVWEELKQLARREEEAYRQRLEDLENAYQKRSLLLEDRCRQAVESEKKTELAKASVEQLNEMRHQLTQTLQWADQLRKALVRCHPKHPDDISSAAFTRYVGNMFTLMGHKVEHLGITGDQGVDLIAINEGVRIAVQVKKYDLDNQVGVSTIQEVYAGKTIHDCQDAQVITTSTFTKAALEMAEKLQVKCQKGKAFENTVLTTAELKYGLK